MFVTLAFMLGMQALAVVTKIHLSRYLLVHASGIGGNLLRLGFITFVY